MGLQPWSGASKDPYQESPILYHLKSAPAWLWQAAVRGEPLLAEPEAGLEAESRRPAAPATLLQSQNQRLVQELPHFDERSNVLVLCAPDLSSMLRASGQKGLAVDGHLPP